MFGSGKPLPRYQENCRERSVSFCFGRYFICPAVVNTVRSRAKNCDALKRASPPAGVADVCFQFAIIKLGQKNPPAVASEVGLYAQLEKMCQAFFEIFSAGSERVLKMPIPARIENTVFALTDKLNNANI